MYAVSSRFTEQGVRNRRAAELAEVQHLRKQVEAQTAEIIQLKTKKLEGRRRARFTYAEIEQRACRVFKVSKTEMHSNRRHRDLVFARQFVMYWATRLTLLSSPQIGKLMGGRDHTTCLHGKRAYREKRAAMGRKLREAR